jgi:hypothetical protein
MYDDSSLSTVSTTTIKSLDSKQRKSICPTKGKTNNTLRQYTLNYLNPNTKKTSSTMHMQSQYNSKWSTVHLNMQHQSTRVISLFMRLSIYYLSECFPKLLSVQRMPLFVLAPKHKSTILYPFLSVNHTSYLYYLCNLPLNTTIIELRNKYYTVKNKQASCWFCIIGAAKSWITDNSFGFYIIFMVSIKIQLPCHEI